MKPKTGSSVKLLYGLDGMLAKKDDRNNKS